MKSATILIVEDEPSWRELYKEIVVDSGYFCEVVASVEKAIEKLQKQFFNLAILDIRLVDPDPANEGGLEILKWLVKKQIDTKVVICTGYPTLERTRSSFLSGKVVDFLSKDTFSESQFLSIISKYGR